MRLWIVALSGVLVSLHALAGALGEQDVAKLKSDIGAMFETLEKGDPELVIASTHESIHALVGGKEAFEKSSREAVRQFLQSGVKFVSSELGTPTQTYPAGEEEVCFVPRISVLEVQGKKAKSTGFMIAIRRVGSDRWKYLDGAALLKNPELLQVLLPKLPADIQLPPNKVELL